jgi:cob(I)alamin adenosyltransferase
MVVHIYTGNGGGKTTAALGLALRAVGHGKNVVIIQFMKGRKETGEYKIRNKLGKHYKIYQFGRKEFVNLENPAEKDIKLAKKALEFAKKSLEKADILILDEVNVAVRFGLISEKELIDFIKKVPHAKWVVLTGRYASENLFEYADFVTEMKDLKHPKKMHYEKGIEW